MSSDVPSRESTRPLDSPYSLCGFHEARGSLCHPGVPRLESPRPATRELRPRPLPDRLDSCIEGWITGDFSDGAAPHTNEGEPESPPPNHCRKVTRFYADFTVLRLQL